MFLLRGGKVSIQEPWHRSDEAAKRQIQAEIAQLPWTPATADNIDNIVASLKYDPSIEWSLCTGELCDLIAPWAHLPLMAINPGVADPAAFDSVAYKGGSEISVVNFTTSKLLGTWAELAWTHAPAGDLRYASDLAATGEAAPMGA